MNVWRELLQLWGAAALLMTAGWLWQRARGNAGIVDVLWALGLGLSAVWLALIGGGAVMPRTMLAVLGGVWGLRLAWHLWRRVRAEPEDGRYRYLRAHWAGDQLKFFGFFQFQAGLVVLFALPFLSVAQNREGKFTAWTALALLVWLVSVGGEALADRQLAGFRSNPANRGRTCRAGLWRYSRHPNYFFEWLHWLSYVALAIGSAVAGLAAVGPIVMYVFLRWVSGIPFTEAQALRTRGEDYRIYQQQTPMFFPWFPRQMASVTKR